MKLITYLHLAPRLTLWQLGWTFKFYHILNVKCEYFILKKIIKTTAVCAEKKGDCATSLKI
jgi:hypothetical protein